MPIKYNPTDPNTLNSISINGSGNNKLEYNLVYLERGIIPNADYSIADFVKVPQLKEVLINKTKEFFVGEGFRLNKSQISYRKETNNAIIIFRFRILSYYPAYNKYHFSSYIVLKELIPIFKEYAKFHNENEKIFWNILFVEGEFINELLSKGRKFQKMYMNKVITSENIEIATNQTFEIIKNEALPKVYTNATLLGFQNYFLRPERIMDRISEDLFILSCLLAAYLINENFYHELTSFITSELNKIITERRHSVYNLIDKLNAFIKYKNA